LHPRQKHSGVIFLLYISIFLEGQTLSNAVTLSAHFIYQFLLDKVILALLLLLLLIAILIPDQAWTSLIFLFDALVGIAPYLILAVVLAAFIKASGLDQSVVRVFSGHPVKTILFAALFGSLSPFCSCGVIPLIASLLAAGVPLAPVMAFWIASPVMDPEMFILTSAGISLDFALAKAAFAILLGLWAGLITLLVVKRGWLKNYLRSTWQSKSSCSDNSCDSTKTCGTSNVQTHPPIQLKFWQDTERLQQFWAEFIQTTFFLGKWLALAFLLESLMLRYVNPQWVQQYIGGDTASAIPLAALIGMPSYLNGYAAIPMVSGLIELGMGQAAAMTFMLTGAVSSIPAAVAVFALVNKKAFVLYVMLGLLGSVLCGYLYYLVWL